MKITYPHMGSLSVAMHGLLEDLGLEVIAPPPITKKTINLGVLHSPEFACFPLKINMGNFIEALEGGADTIIMAGGTGPCRFGYYAEVQREILRDLGYEFAMIVLEPPQGHLSQLTDKLRELCGDRNWPEITRALHTAWRKVKALDRLHSKVLQVRPRELERGAATKAYEQAQQLVAAARTPRDVDQSLHKGLEMLGGVPCDYGKGVLRIGLVGEIYMILEPYANLDLEKTLGEMGVEVDRSIYISHWIKEHLVLSSLGLKGSRDTKKAAAMYLNHFVGGHGWESVGDTVRYARRGYDGVVHILPFTCTPEIVAQSILPTVSREQGIPVISFSMDEQSGQAGFVTRLEAFLDLLQQRKTKTKLG
ncbi:MAG: CoA protein activase [Bacillota bacterium]|nr:CoA protein activase [Bacillota bacterium]MDW7684076.1 CoA protein activase [Bacillota bacterium]